MRAARSVSLAAGMAGAFAFALLACFFDLDPSRLNPGDGGGGGANVDAGAATPWVSSCDQDDDCVSPDACHVGRCDRVTLTCAYASCRPEPCAASVCDRAAGRCAPTAAVRFEALSFPVSGGIGCGGNVRRCAAAVHPYLFVGAGGGVAAFSVAAAAAEPPSQLRVDGIGFAPGFIVASGRRVWFLARGSGSDLRVAWIDVPTDPTRTSFTAREVVMKPSRNDLFDVFAAPRNGVFVVAGDGASRFPTALLQDPVDGGTLGLHTPPDGGGPLPPVVAATGARTVVLSIAQTPAPNEPILAFVTQAGTSRAARGAPQRLLATLGPVAPVNRPQLTTGPTGMVLWNAAAAAVPDGFGTGEARTRAIRTAWITNDARDPEMSAYAVLDIESYDPPRANLSGGAVAWVDDETAIALAEAATDARQTSVQAVTRVPAPRVLGRVLIDTQTGQTTVASSFGLGYVLSAKFADSSIVRVIAPRCSVTGGS